MKATITPDQQDALDEQLVTRLDGLGDIEIAFKAGNLRDAERHAREHADELYVLAALREMREQSELGADPDVVRRVMERMRAIAEGDTTGLAPQMAELRKDTEKNRLVAEACTSVLHAVAKTGTVTDERAAGEAPHMSRERPILPRG